MTIQNPIDQPLGRMRLPEELKQNLSSNLFDEFIFISAFAKVGPLVRLQPRLDTWKQAGKTIQAIFGVDQKGTSIQALEFSLSNFNNVFIANIEVGVFTPTFHPKSYIFKGQNKTIA